MNHAPSRIAVLGATGTIGRNTLDVIARHPERFQVTALTAQHDAAGLAELCNRHRPARAVIGAKAVDECRQRFSALRLQTELLVGPEALNAVASSRDVDQVVAGIVGAAGLVPTLAAVRAGKRVLLANKEPLVMAGALFMRTLAQSGAVLLPLDSEHNAVFQCLPPGPVRGQTPAGVKRICLTASGGPFRNTPLAQLSQATIDDALKHPNWRMGPKISVDSATMMNKGLEVIEAAWLFGLPLDRISVVLHPQSTLHALVEYADGSWLAQLGQPDMRTPIAQALAWPERIEAGVEPLDLLAMGRLDFAPLDERRYPCFPLAQQAAALGGLAPAALNAANEVAVAGFLAGNIRFTGIAAAIEQLLGHYPSSEFASANAENLDAVLACDVWARAQTHTLLKVAA